MVHSFAEFQAQFGGLVLEMPLGYAVQQYFLNGGRKALIARVVPSGSTLTDADLSSPALEAKKRGLWLLEHADHPFNILCIPPLSMPWGSPPGVCFPAQSFSGARGHWPATSRTRSSSFRCGALTCSSSRASRAACNGPCSSPMAPRCGSASAPASRILLGLF